jgi:predicted SnoaL-like aldol condensation-catalyzing enzyme
MTTHGNDGADLVRRMQEAFNTRQFDLADELFTPSFHSHALGTTGFAVAKEAWRRLTAEYPDIRVVAEDILVDGDKVAIRSSATGVGAVEGDGEGPLLLEIFRVENGRLAEMWGAASGYPRSPGEVVGAAGR